MEMEVEEDDLLFAELSRRISLLIMDDDDDPLPIVHTNLTRTMNLVRPRQLPLTIDYEHNFVRESKGTGVFIPARLPPPARRRQKNVAGFRMKSENKRLSSQPSSTYYFKPKKN